MREPYDQDEDPLDYWQGGIISGMCPKCGREMPHVKYEVIQVMPHIQVVWTCRLCETQHMSKGQRPDADDFGPADIQGEQDPEPTRPDRDADNEDGEAS